MGTSKNSGAAHGVLPRGAQIAAEAREELVRYLGCARLPALDPGRALEIEPGVRVAPAACRPPSRVVVYTVEPAGNGLYRMVESVRGVRVRLTRAALREWGIGVSYNTLRRLILGGFVVGEQPTPGVVQMDLESYFAHERATADPEFWSRDNGANAKRLRLAVAGTIFYTSRRGD